VGGLDSDLSTAVLEQYVALSSVQMITSLEYTHLSSSNKGIMEGDSTRTSFEQDLIPSREVDLTFDLHGSELLISNPYGLFPEVGNGEMLDMSAGLFVRTHERGVRIESYRTLRQAKSFSARFFSLVAIEDIVIYFTPTLQFGNKDSGVLMVDKMSSLDFIPDCAGLS